MSRRRILVLAAAAVGLVALGALAWGTGAEAAIETLRASTTRDGRGFGSRATWAVDGSTPVALLDDAGVLAPPDLTDCFEVQVFDVAGAPVADALVLATDEGLEAHPTRAVYREERRTGADGVARLCTTPELAGLTVDAWDDADGWGRRPVGRRARRGVPIPILVAPAFRLRGRAVDARGRPAADARLFLNGSTASPGFWNDHNLLVTDRAELRADADGYFDLEIAYHGTFHLRAEREGLMPTYAGPFQARPGTVIDAEIVMADGAVLEGRVVTPSGPAAGARVAISVGGGSERQADVDGRFAFRSLDARRRYELVISAPGYAPARHSELGVGEHTFSLEPAATLDVEVRVPTALEPCLAGGRRGDAPAVESRRPGAPADLGGGVHVQLEHAPDLHSARISRAGIQTVRFEDVAAGEHEVVVSYLDLEARETAPLVAGRSHRSSLQLALSPRSGWLLLHGARGHREISVRSTDENQLGRVHRPAEGCARLSPGTYTLSAPGDEVWVETVEIRGGRVTELHVPARVEPPGARNQDRRTCGWRPREGGFVATRACPDAAVLPGDRVIGLQGEPQAEMDTLRRALTDRESEVIVLRLERPNGSRYWATLGLVPSPF